LTRGWGAILAVFLAGNAKERIACSLPKGAYRCDDCFQAKRHEGSDALLGVVGRLLVSRTILVVDDSLSIRMLVSKVLKQEGYGVLEAANGRLALEKLQGQTPVNLVITDVNMPVMDGIELVRAIREDTIHKFTPVIFLTTEMDEAKKDEARAAGATAWIVKPFLPEKVLAVVHRALP
jgi:two-component system chemotaxis response regulator CheY